MSLVDKIKSDLISARKIKSNDIRILSMIYSEIISVGKNNGNRETTDEEAIKVLTKLKKSVIETRDLAVKSGLESGRYAAMSSNHELLIINKYLPKLMTKEELSLVIKDYISKIDAIDKSTIGKIMKSLKTDHPGEYDGKLASQLISSIIKEIS